jgi:hypothetical protein
MMFPKPESRARVKRDKDNAAERSWQIVRKQVLQRDGHRCRVGVSTAAVCGCEDEAWR